MDTFFDEAGPVEAIPRTDASSNPFRDAPDLLSFGGRAPEARPVALLVVLVLFSGRAFPLKSHPSQGSCEHLESTPVSNDFNPERRCRAVRAYSSGALAVK